MSKQRQKRIQYIMKREKDYQKKLRQDDRTYQQKLLRLYNRAMDRIVREVEHEYLRYAGKEGLTMDEAMEKISKFDAAAFSDKAKRYVEERDFSDRANEELRAYNLKIRTSRLELMKREILLETISLADREEAMLSQRLSEVALEELNRQAVILGLSQTVRKRVLKYADTIIDSNFHGARFSDRIWANQAELQNRLEDGIVRTVIQGQNTREWQNNLLDLMTKEMTDTGKKNALYAASRLAITETSRVFSETALESYRQGGYTKFIWIAELDHRTCSVCEPLDGQIFNIADVTVGVDMPPIHPFCRCTTAAYEDRDDWQGYMDAFEESLAL